MGAQPASNRRVLLVEDDYFIADAMRAILDLENWQVLGPFANVATAQKALDEGAEADIAVLDVNLAGERVFPLVDRLLREGVPVLLTTGYDASAIPAAYATLPHVLKPVQTRTLIGLMEQMLDK